MIETGRGRIPFVALLAIWSVSALTSLPGLAVSPILDKLTKIFPDASEMEIQMLTSLPSLLIIPFVLLSGRLADRVGFMRMLNWGLWIFLLSGVLYMMCGSMWQLVAVSALLGVGAGIIIPLSTALVSRYFVGEYRTRQFGYSSAITNASLVVATALTGYLADIWWRLPFVVYLLPLLSIVLVQFLARQKGVETENSKKSSEGLNPNDNFALTLYSLYYFFITFLIVAINVNLPFLMGEYGFGSDSAGVITSLFFLAIMLPGFFLSPLLRVLKGRIAATSLVLIGCGLLLVYLYKSLIVIAIGCIVAGVGYGVAQPYIYDRATIVAPRNTALVLAIVMAMNYIAIVVAPFVIDNLQTALHDGSQRFAFGLNAALAFVAVVPVLLLRFIRARRRKASGQ